MNAEEIELILLAQRGDVAAFEKLVRIHEKTVLQTAYHFLNDEEDAKDVYQEVFYKMFQKISTFQFKSEFSTWLYRITVNCCINFRKKRERINQVEEKISNLFNDGESHIGYNASSPEKELLNLELSRKIAESIDKLSPKQRTVFVLKHYQGLKLTEIAAIMGSAEGTVKNYLFRAMEKLRNQLKSYRQN